MIPGLIYQLICLGYFLSKPRGLCEDHGWPAVLDLTSCKNTVHDIQEIRPNAFFWGSQSENGAPGGCHLRTVGSGDAIKFNDQSGSRSHTGRQICIPNKGTRLPNCFMLIKSHV